MQTRYPAPESLSEPYLRLGDKSDSLRNVVDARFVDEASLARKPVHGLVEFCSIVVAPSDRCEYAGKLLSEVISIVVNVDGTRSCLHWRKVLPNPFGFSDIEPSAARVILGAPAKVRRAFAAMPQDAMRTTTYAALQAADRI
jgi:hypothetical protein